MNALQDQDHKQYLNGDYAQNKPIHPKYILRLRLHHQLLLKIPSVGIHKESVGMLDHIQALDAYHDHQ